MKKRPDLYGSDLEVIPDSEDERLRCDVWLQLLPTRSDCPQTGGS